MPDTLERDLAARLRTIGDAVPDAVEPPRDLQRRVNRRRKHRTRVVQSVLALAACLGLAVAVMVVIEHASESPHIDVTARGVRPSAMNLLADTVMLDARGQWAAGLDAGGHQIITVATSHSGRVVDAQLTRDHKTLWYLSVAGKPGIDCGRLVRADIASGDSFIVASAVAFGISPDGNRLALSGRGVCAPATGAQLAVRDLRTDQSAASTVAPVPTVISWSPNGDRVVTSSCATEHCGKVVAFDVPARLDGRLEASPFDTTGRPAFGPDGVYIAVGPTVVRVSGTHPTTVVVRSAAAIAQVIPTTNGTYVVTRSRPHGPADELSRVANGRLVPVRTFADGFGTMSPVWQPR